MLLIGGIFIIAVALLFLSDTIFQRRSIRQTLKWKSAKGIILKSELDYQLSTNIDLEPAQAKSYFPNIQYEYEVNNITYRGKEIYLFGHINKYKKSTAEAYVSRYTKGQEVEVFYKPFDPAQSVLLKGLHGRNIYRGRIILGVLLLLLGSFLIFCSIVF